MYGQARCVHIRSCSTSQRQHWQSDAVLLRSPHHHLNIAGTLTREVLRTIVAETRPCEIGLPATLGLWCCSCLDPAVASLRKVRSSCKTGASFVLAPPSGDVLVNHWETQRLIECHEGHWCGKSFRLFACLPKAFESREAWLLASPSHCRPKLVPSFTVYQMLQQFLGQIVP